jgi:hypothetical protein
MLEVCKGKSVTLGVDRAAIGITQGSTSFDVRLVDTPYMTREEKAAFEAASEAAYEAGKKPPMAPMPIATDETPIGGYDVAALSAVCTGQRVKSTGALVFAPVKKSAADTMMLSNGEVDLVDLKKNLAERNIKAVYSVVSGKQRVVVEGNIVVEKGADGRLKLEGSCCEVWFKVREVLYGQYVMI